MNILWCVPVLVVLSGVASAQAPSTTPSADGRTVAGGGMSLSASQVTDLVPGQTVTVSGTGYDPGKGIYVALCVVPPPGQVPSPCGGGQDRAGSTGASAWVTSNAPDSDGLSQPYGPGGSFSVTLVVGPTINSTLDCRQLRCAIVTRNDHHRGSDRSQDLLLPVTFADPTATTVPGPTTTLPPVTTTAPPTTTTQPAPPATVAEDGSSVTDGARTLDSSATRDLDPAGATVTVTGQGFPVDVGVYVALCRMPEVGAPGPCTAGGDGSAWLDSTPPAAGADLAQPFEADGSFELDLVLPAVIDAGTDCRAVACALTVRRDDTAAADRTADLLLPVTFAATSPTTTSAPEPASAEVAATTAGDDGPGGGESSPFLPIVAVAGVVALVAGVVAVQRRRGPAA
jgi:hypothetical protein